MVQVSEILRLPEFLHWDSIRNVSEIARAIHLRWALSQVRRAAAADPRISSEFDALPEASQLRILLAPEVCWVLRRPEQAGGLDIERLRRFIQMEWYIRDPSVSVEPRSWTALGDYYSGTGAPRGETAFAPEYASDHPFAAPHAAGIVLDTNSPHYPGVFPKHLQLIRYKPAAHASIVDRLERAFERLSQVSETAAAMVREATKVISVAETSTDRPDMAISASWRFKFGMVGLINIHTERWSTARLCDALVHEAIHSTLYKIELEEELFQNFHAANQERATSPWSNRSLTVASFVHACFVWYGLWNFWSLDHSPDPAVSEFRQRAHTGFLQGPLLARLSESGSDCISETARQAIHEMQSRVEAQSPVVADV